MHEKLEKIIIEKVEHTFLVMFGIKVYAADNVFLNFNDDDLVVLVNMQQSGVSVCLRLVFPRTLLKPLLHKVYPPEFAIHEMSYEDCACEIANIVCNGLKAFLNENGYALMMDIPEIDYNTVCRDIASGDSKHLSVVFILQDDGFSVDLVMKESSTTKEAKLNE